MEKKYLDCVCIHCTNEMRIEMDDQNTIHIHHGEFKDTLAMEVICEKCSTLQALPIDVVATIYQWAGIDTEEDMQHISLLYANKTKELINGQIYTCPKCESNIQVFVYVDDSKDVDEITGQIIVLGGKLEDNTIFCGECNENIIDVK